MSNSLSCVIRAGAIRDASGVIAQPGVIVIHDGVIVAAVSPADIDAHDLNSAPVMELPGVLVMPALVNAHAHLDLTPIGPQAFQGSFVGWVRRLIEQWNQYAANFSSPQQAAQHAVQLGAQLSLAQGVGFVADISDEPTAALAMERAGLSGVSYLEVLGIGGATLDEGLEAIRQRQQDAEFSIRPHAPQPLSNTAAVRLGIQPHAPYSTGPSAYQAAAELGDRMDLPLSTHLAETTEELEFVARGSGPFRQLLESMGKWDKAFLAHYGRNQHPIDWLEPILDQLSGFRTGRKFKGQFRNRWLLAHCNYAGDDQIEVLARTGVSVAYCPMASDYFGHPRAGTNELGQPRLSGHRYRAMMEAMVNVCLGTDSILCQPVNSPQPLSILQQMRHIYRRDSMAPDLPDLLLGMATVNGLRAMGFDEKLATLGKGVPAQLIGVKFDENDATDPLVQVLKNDEPVTPITLPS